LSSKPMWAHQTSTINRAFEPYTDELALLHEQGTGKTRTLIEILRRLFAADGRVLRTLILCPKTVKKQWKEQILEYSKIKANDIVILDKSESRRCKDFTDATLIDGQLNRGKIVILNPAGLEMKKLMELIRRWGPEVLIVDESHEYKAHNGIRSKALLPIADNARKRYIATGTPIANTESDIFMQYRILDGGKTFGKNFYVFRKLYYVDKNASWAHKQNHFPKYECTEDAKKEISRLMYQKAVRALKSDCLDLPPLVRQMLEVELSKEQEKAYNEMKKDYITWMKDKRDEPRAVVAQLALTKAMKMQQIVSGFAFAEDGTAVRFKSVPRLEVLKDHLERLCKEHKVIVWAAFIENYKMIAEVCEELGIGYAKIVGGQNGMERDEEKVKFKTDDTCRVLIANQKAGGTGLDGMQLASYAIYYSKSASLLEDSQSEARNYRAGSEVHDKVTRIDLVALNTIDEAVNDALSQKKDLAQFILDEGVI